MKRLAIGSSTLLPYLLIAAVALLRLSIGHPYNFIPVFSCLIFFGACRPTREFALAVFTLVGVDIFLTTHQYGFVLTAGHAVTWIWYLGVVILGAAALGTSLSFARVLSSSLVASVSFFVVSNFTVWAEWGMYPKTWSGLCACYVAALPFFRNSVIAETLCSLLILMLARYSEQLLIASRVRHVDF